MGNEKLPSFWQDSLELSNTVCNALQGLTCKEIQKDDKGYIEVYNSEKGQLKIELIKRKYGGIVIFVSGWVGQDVVVKDFNLESAARSFIWRSLSQ